MMELGRGQLNYKLYVCMFRFFKFENTDRHIVVLTAFTICIGNQLQMN
jgi:hypothetical protein